MEASAESDDDRRTADDVDVELSVALGVLLCSAPESYNTSVQVIASATEPRSGTSLH